MDKKALFNTFIEHLNHLKKSFKNFFKASILSLLVIAIILLLLTQMDQAFTMLVDLVENTHSVFHCFWHSCSSMRWPLYFRTTLFILTTLPTSTIRKIIPFGLKYIPLTFGHLENFRPTSIKPKKIQPTNLTTGPITFVIPLVY